MKTSLTLMVSITSQGIEKSFPLEVVCVHGAPTGDPSLEVEIPVMVKEVLFEDKPLDWPTRQFFIQAIGGRETLCQLCKQG